MQRKTIVRLIEDVRADLERMGYSPKSLMQYRQHLNRFKRYADSCGEEFMSEDLCRDYMMSQYSYVWESGEATTSSYVRAQSRALKTLLCRERCGKLPIGHCCCPKEPDEVYRQLFGQYIAECESRGLSPKTLYSRRSDVCLFLDFLKDKGITDLERLEPGLLEQFLLIFSEKSPGGMGRMIASLNCFLRSIFSCGITERDLSHFVPSPSRYRTKPVQKIWSSDEVGNLLDNVDRSDSTGKRDYAIMLLIVRYGMRVSDITNLRLTDIHWDPMVITFVQHKTRVPNTLPITDDVGWALADWLTNGRPKQTVTDHVFVRLRVPYCGMSGLNNLMVRCRLIAGIQSPQVNAGPHSLRHALASRMLAENTPFDVISSVLGHTSATSTSVYLHTDIEGLRQCAIDTGGDDDGI